MIFTFYDVTEFNNYGVIIFQHNISNLYIYNFLFFYNFLIFIIFGYTIADNNLNEQLKYYCGQKVFNETIVMKHLIFNFEIH